MRYRKIAKLVKLIGETFYEVSAIVVNGSYIFSINVMI